MKFACPKNDKVLAIFSKHLLTEFIIYNSVWKSD